MDTHTPLPTTATTAGARFVTRCLRRSTSLFTPRERRWTGEALVDLAARLERAARRADDPNLPRTGAFIDRWARLLVRCDEATVALAAEALYVHLLWPTNVSGSRKRALLGATLARHPDPPPIPADLDAALDQGIAPAGVAYSRRRLTQLAWLAAAVGRWRALAPADRRRALTEPPALLAVLGDVPVRGGGPQRAALLHLVHPATFAPVTSLAVRTAILDAFRADIPDGADDPDLALAGVRAALARRHGTDVSFFEPSVRARWQ